MNKTEIITVSPEVYAEVASDQAELGQACVYKRRSTRMVDGEPIVEVGAQFLEAFVTKLIPPNRLEISLERRLMSERR